MQEDDIGRQLAVHRLSWADFDEMARGEGGTDVVRRLRQAERSRRLLLLRALVDDVTKSPELAGPLPSSEAAWELLARVQATAPRVLDRMLAHPYTGSWAGYTTRLLHNRITGVCPLWMHIGHLHAVAAAAAIRAGLDFDTVIPLWNSGAILPTLGLARLAAGSAWSMAAVHGERGQVEVSNATDRVRLPDVHSMDAPGWWPVRRLTLRAGGQRLSVRIEDVDPYRGLYEPIPPQRLDAAEVAAWHTQLDGAWHLIVRHLPGMASALSAGLDSLVPRPAVPFRMPSSSSGEAFGSAIVAQPSDAASLAATLVHEFQHIRLGGLLHLARLHHDDPGERFYTAWREDPRPIGGVLQGVYAFFGVTAFWRALTGVDSAMADRRAAFEFAYWRGQTWRTLQALRRDPGLTPAGRRFVHGIAERLGRWRDEPVPPDLADRAAAAATDHYAGWRIRHVRPSREVVRELADAWCAGHAPLAGPRLITDEAPTPVPDGPWSSARADLTRLALGQPVAGASVRGLSRQKTLAETWTTVPDATAADFAYAAGRFTDAVRGYRAELAEDADRAAAWIGLGLALSALGASPAARALLGCPEVVRAVHREIRTRAARTPTPEDLAAWIGLRVP